MSLTVAYNTARSSLHASQTQMATVSRNITSATDPSYSRKISSLVTQNGAVRVVTWRSSDTPLFSKMIETTSNAATQKAYLEGLERLSKTIGDTELDESPAARIGTLNNALQKYANAPDNLQYARAFVEAATGMASSLNKATADVQAARLEADNQIADSVARINDLLAKFQVANDEVMKGAALGADVSDSMDVRDNLISQLSEEIGVTVVHRAGEDIALYTDSGVPLFDRSARTVSFAPTNVYVAGTTGNAVFIDGVQVTGAGSPMPLNSGTIVGLAKLRDETAVTYQKQLDEIARGLIEAFAENNITDPTQPDMPGVFTNDPPAGTGLAGRIKINTLIDPTKNPLGNYNYIRDGGLNGLDYTYNLDPTGNAAFSDRLKGLVDEMKTARTFDPSLGLGADVTLQEFASSSASWVEASRQSTSRAFDYQLTLLGHASEALSNATDVNMDDETALMLQLEKSYSAAAKLISTIDEMLKTLLNAV